MADIKPLTELANDVNEGDEINLAFNEIPARLRVKVEKKYYQGDEVHKTLTTIDLTSFYTITTVPSRITFGDKVWYCESRPPNRLPLNSVKGYEVLKRAEQKLEQGGEQE